MCASTAGLSSFCIVLLFMHGEGLVVVGGGGAERLRHKQQKHWDRWGGGERERD